MIVIANVNRHFVIDRSENVKERVISQGTLERKELFGRLNDFVTAQKCFIVCSAVSQSKIKENGSSSCDGSYPRATEI